MNAIWLTTAGGRESLDTSVILAACGSPAGASRAVFDSAADHGWNLLTSDYVLSEVATNLPALPNDTPVHWAQLRAKLAKVPDVLTFEWTSVFVPAKDRPILFTAAASADVLLTLDQRDFGDLLGSAFYGLAIMKPGDFLKRERSAGRMRTF